MMRPHDHQQVILHFLNLLFLLSHKLIKPQLEHLLPDLPQKKVPLFQFLNNMEDYLLILQEVETPQLT